MTICYCSTDRYDLRNGNPAPLKFYLKEEKEVCVIEFFANSNVGGWRLLNKGELKNTQSFQIHGSEKL
ncbi:hypothetical protein T11_366 [Trichinella zimbabwensis]|uniref:Uncharacterized protein n=1 Tax=Trichinella zimbabwensis TaxID=268475 RepID=A0A0V1HWQ4_9BILA|nr:hypothetical protein T11_366 [Trichinella zimbabwensis]